MLIGDHRDINGNIAPVKVEDTILKYVQQFEYLGRILSNNADDSLAVEARIGCGWSAFNKVKSILTCRHISMSSKKKTYETYVRPTVLYASETVTWKQSLQEKVTVFQNHVMRWMLGKRLRDRMSITELCRITCLQPLMNQVRERKLKWFGHIKRSSLPVRVVVEGMVEGKRGRGRPQRRWRDDVKQWTKLGWDELNCIVKNRQEWRTYQRG